ncbi:hypothetical protein WJ969_05550 [Achromobacter xylosoxidans]
MLFSSRAAEPVALARVIRGGAHPQRIDGRAAFDHDRLRLVDDQQHFGRAQLGAGAHDDVAAGAGCRAQLAVSRRHRLVRPAAERQAVGGHRVQIPVPQRDAGRRGRGRVVDDLERRAVGANQQLAAIAVPGGREAGLAVEPQRRPGAGQVAIVELQRRRVGGQHRPRLATARGLGQHEGAVVHLVVLGMPPQHVAGVTSACRGMASTAPVLDRPRMAATDQDPPQRTGVAAQRALPQLDAIGAGQQGVVGRQQGIGARGQAGHAGADRDGLAGARTRAGVAAGFVARRHRRVAVGQARHDRVDRPVRQRRQVEFAARGIEPRQGMEQRIGGAASPADEPRARQGASAGQVDDRAGIHRDRSAQQGNAPHHLEDVGAADAHGLHRRALVKVAQAVDGAAIGHGQARRADGGQAAGQQPHLAGIAVDADAHDDTSQRRKHVAALLHVGRVQGQRAEHGQRRDASLRTGHALDPQHRVGVIGNAAAAPPGHRQPLRARGGIDPLPGQQQVARRQDGAGVALPADGDVGGARGGQEPQVTPAAQGHVVVATTFDGQLAAAAQPGRAGHAGIDAVADIDLVGVDFKQRGAR